MIDIKVPNVGESVSEVTIAVWMKKVGEAVKKDEPLVELETDKAAQELVAPADGVLAEILVPEGENAEIGVLIARLSTDGVASVVVEEKPAQEVALTPKATSEKDPMPSAQRIIKEKGLDAGSISGFGKDGRITKGDALAAPIPTKAPAVPTPIVSASTPRETGPREERVRMSRLRQTIARRLKDAQNTAAMLTTYNEVDMSNIMDLRKKYKQVFIDKHGVKLGFMSFFVKACVTALKDVPNVNAEIDGTDVIYKNYYDISIAVGTDKGLVVPVCETPKPCHLQVLKKALARWAKKPATASYPWTI